MWSSVNYKLSKQVAQWNRTSEQEAFSEKVIKDSFKMENILLSQLRRNVLISLILATSVTHSLPGALFNNRGANIVEISILEVTYLRCYLAFVYIFATGFVASIAIACMLQVAAIVLADVGIIWRLRWLQELQSEDAVRGVLVILGIPVVAMVNEVGLCDLCNGRHLECLMMQLLCFYIMALVWSQAILMPHWRKAVACHGYSFSSWVLERCTGVAMIWLTAAFTMWSHRSVMSSIEFSALVVTILLCSGLEFQALLRNPLENRDYSVLEALLNYSKLDKADLQHHRDAAMSDPQESVAKWHLFGLPTDEDEDMKRKTENGYKLLLLLAVLAASLTYQAGLSPPCASWQENKADHVVGSIVLNDNHRRRYMAFLYCNATAFITSVAIILLLVNRKLFARGILSNMLSVCVIIDIVGLAAAFTAVRSRRASTSNYVFVPVFAVLVCTALHVLDRVGSGSLADHYALQRRDREERSKYLINFATQDLLRRLIGINAAGNYRTSESADPAVDDEHDATRPIKRCTREATWRVACAAPHHMTGNQSLLLTSSYMPVHDGNLANGEAVPPQVRGSGSVRTESIVLDDVWYVPGLDSNLVSSGQLARQGCAVSLSPGGCSIIRGGGALVGTARFTEECQFELDFLKVAA